MPHLTRFRFGLLTLASVTTFTGRLAAQAAQTDTTAPTERGSFVIRRGGDTVAIELFARTATTLHGTLALRNDRNTSQAYQAIVAPDASVPLIEVTVRENLDSGRVTGKVVQRARVIFKDDSAAVDDITGHGMQTRLFATERGVIPYLNLSFALLEQAIRRSWTSMPHASRVAFFNLGGGQTVEAKLSPLGADSLAVSIGTVDFHLKVDAAGRVLGGTIPAQQVVAERAAGG